VSEEKEKLDNEEAVLDDPFMDEEEEDIILKTQMKVYDLFMGNWKKLVYIMVTFLIGTLVYGLYESSQEEALRKNSSMLAKSTTSSFISKNKSLANFASLNQDFQRALEEAQKSQSDPNKIMESIQLQMKAREMSEELYISRALFYGLDSILLQATFIKPYDFDRASFYSTSHVGNALSHEKPTLMNLTELRDSAVQLSDTVEKLEGETKIFGYLKLSQLWRSIEEKDAAINALNTALQLKLTPTQEWMVSSQLSQVYLEKGEVEKGMTLLQDYISKMPADDFFVEYANYNLAMLHELKGDAEAAKNVLTSITPVRFVEEYQQMIDRL
jgi:predicted negative regulator of RcsB-dependent stress response